MKIKESCSLVRIAGSRWNDRQPLVQKRGFMLLPRFYNGLPAPLTTDGSTKLLDTHKSSPATSATLRFFSSSSSSQKSEANTDSTSPEQLEKTDFNFCVDLVRQRDLEGFLCGLLMPSLSQRAYFALRALNVELASVKEGRSIAGSNTGSGASLAQKMRMQWWREAIKQVYSSQKGDDGREHDAGSSAASLTSSLDPSMARHLNDSYMSSPIVRTLGRVVEKNGQAMLTRRFLERLIEAREADLDMDQFDTLEQAIQYAEESASSLLYLSLECCGVQNDEADAIASHAGVGIGLTTMLRATPARYFHNGEVAIPAQLFPSPKPVVLLEGDEQSRPAIAWIHPNEEHIPLHVLRQVAAAATDHDEDLNPDAVQEARIMLRDAARAMAQEATAQLLVAREGQGHVPRAGKTALLPMIPATSYLSRLEAVDYDVFHPSLVQGSSNSERLRLMLTLGRTWITGVF